MRYHFPTNSHTFKNLLNSFHKDMSKEELSYHVLVKV